MTAVEKVQDIKDGVRSLIDDAQRGMCNFPVSRHASLVELVRGLIGDLKDLLLDLNRLEEML